MNLWTGCAHSNRSAAQFRRHEMKATGPNGRGHGLGLRHLPCQQCDHERLETACGRLSHQLRLCFTGQRILDSVALTAFKSNSSAWTGLPAHSR